MKDTSILNLPQPRGEKQTSLDSEVRLIGSDPVALKSISTLVRSIGFTADVHLSVESFLRQYDVDRPGCLVADLGKTGMNGIEVLRELNETESPLPAIFIASQASVADTVNLMQLGAVTLLEIPYRDGTLLDAIRSAVRLDAERRTVAARCHELDQRMSRLSEDECNVLHDLIAGETNKRIAIKRGIALRTVECRRRNIFSKLEVQSSAEMAAAVAELERLTDIGALLKAPPVRLTDSRFTSFSMPMWLRSVGGHHTQLNPAHTETREPAHRDRSIRDRVAN